MTSKSSCVCHCACICHGWHELIFTSANIMAVRLQHENFFINMWLCAYLDAPLLFLHICLTVNQASFSSWQEMKLRKGWTLLDLSVCLSSYPTMVTRFPPSVVVLGWDLHFCGFDSSVSQLVEKLSQLLLLFLCLPAGGKSDTLNITEDGNKQCWINMVCFRLERKQI